MYLQPRTPSCCVHPFLPFERETEKTFEIAYCRLLSEAAVSSAARQQGSSEFVDVAGAVEVDVAGSSTAENGPTALALCVCVCVGQRETSRLVELCAAIRSQSANTPGRGGAETAAKQVLAGETAAGGRGGIAGSWKGEALGMFWSLYYSCGHLQTALKMGNDLLYSSFVHSAEHV